MLGIIYEVVLTDSTWRLFICARNISNTMFRYLIILALVRKDVSKLSGLPVFPGY